MVASRRRQLIMLIASKADEIHNSLYKHDKVDLEPYVRAHQPYTKIQQHGCGNIFSSEHFYTQQWPMENTAL